MKLIFGAVYLLSFLQQISSFCVSNGQSDSEECLMNESNKCCKTLSYLLHNLEDSHNVCIQVQTDTTISRELTIQGFENLTIEGVGIVELKCTNSSSGFYLSNVSGLLLKDLTIRHCSMLQERMVPVNWNSDFVKIWCAVFITNSRNLVLDGVSIASNRGTGLFLYNNSGLIQVSNSNFTDNIIQEDSQEPGGGGLSIELARCFPNETNSYIIEDSNFIRNYAFQPDYMDLEQTLNVYSYRSDYFIGLGRGGGLYVMLRGGSCGTVVNITGCKFINNTASTWGGGAYISLRDNSRDNVVSVSDTDFIGNSCSSYGGGGVQITLLSYHGVLLQNTIIFKNCNITGNCASEGVGGGLLLVSTRENTTDGVTRDGVSESNISFTNCVWSKNTALFGSAVDIYPAFWDILGNGLLPIPMFIDCTFMENYRSESLMSIHESINQIKSGVGTFMISNFAVKFEGLTNFTRNSGSGIYLQSGIMYLQSNSEIIFSENRAKVGGGIALLAFSVIYVSENSCISFHSNIADSKGGAMYVYPIDVHAGSFSNSCFLQTRNRTSAGQNISITFDGNTAQSNVGNSIYATSLNACRQESCRKEHDNFMDYFSCVANITGLDKDNVNTQSSKHVYEDSENRTDLNQVVPGYLFRVPIAAYDELNSSVTGLYEVLLENINDSSIKLGEKSLYVTDETILLHSEKRRDSAKLLLSSSQVTTVSIDVETVECPPGYEKNNNSLCKCHTSKFNGIWRCNNTDFTASIISGFWIGLCSSEKQCTGYCPAEFCVNNVSTRLDFRITETHRLCKSNREGKLCGRCAQNHSVFYHSPSYRCDSNALCKYGMLFYILAEIVPLTIVFTVIILCNISFTSGAINGVILYAQIFDLFIMNFFHSNLPQPFQVLTKIYRFIYTTTNMNYFTLEELSFCLWPGATTLDIIAMKYVTIVYALLLILLTVFLLNTVTCKKLCVCWRPHNLKTAVIHGFSAFLVMCYSQCAKVSFMLLTPTTLSEYGPTRSDKVILFSGENKPFDEVHLKYGIPALFFMLLIVILPPLALVLYPLSFKVLGLCHLSELKVVNWIANRIPVQFFDSFQSCYKDNFRFFSGLYFFYRLVPFVLFAAFSDLANFHFLVEVFLILALVLNATLQPYKKHWHNVADSLIFANLAIINAISLYNFHKINDGKDNLNQVRKYIIASTSVQLVLIYLPLVYVLLCLCWLAVRWVRKKVKEWKLSRLDYSQETLLDSIYLPPLRERSDLEKNSDILSTEYLKYNN